MDRDLLSEISDEDKSPDTYTAQWDDECNRCGSFIFEGNEIGYVNDELVCEGCWDNA